MDGVKASSVSRVEVYWCVWLGIVAVALALRFAFLSSDGEHTGLVLSYVLGTWLPIMVLNVIEGHQLMSYLREHHYQKWAELTHTPFGPGGQNGFRMLPWLLSGDDQGDPALAGLKRGYRRFLALVLTVFFSMPVMVVILSL